MYLNEGVNVCYLLEKGCKKWTSKEKFSFDTLAETQNKR